MLGYLGALTYKSGLVVLTANCILVVGPYEEQTYKFTFNQLGHDKMKTKAYLKSYNYCNLQGIFTASATKIVLNIF